MNTVSRRLPTSFNFQSCNTKKVDKGKLIWQKKNVKYLYARIFGFWHIKIINENYSWQIDNKAK